MLAWGFGFWRQRIIQALSILFPPSAEYTVVICVIVSVWHTVVLWGMVAYIRDWYGAFCQPNLESGCYEMMVFRVCTMRQNIIVLSLYHNQIFDCLLMVTVQAEDVHSYFLFVGGMNGHPQEWLGSKTINHHGVAAFVFTTVSGCDQLVVSPTHACGGTLELLMTDVPDKVWVTLVAPISN